MPNKERLSATVDASLIAAAELAVREGRAQSISGWVAAAMERHVAHEERMTAGAKFFELFEEEFGVITKIEEEEAMREIGRRSVRTVPQSRPKAGKASKRPARAS